MAKNDNFYTARISKNDEFYTQLSDIENECKHYRKHFKDKIIYCNCDDPTYSNFWKYFHLNFEFLGLKKLISVHYLSNDSNSYKFEYTGGNDEDIIFGTRTNLKSNGDFRNQECIDVLQEADIIVTNPPFSLFREYVVQLIKYDKKFIIWGNNNAVTYKEFFPYIKDNKVWLGHIVNKTCIFRVGEGYKYDEKLTSEINDSNRYGKVSAISVFTNLDIDKHHEHIILHRKYNPIDYPKYENYEAINVNKITDIPVDYNGVMGVPITFLGKHCPDQFEVVGMASGNARKTGFYYDVPCKPHPKDKGGCGVIAGETQYARILIKKKQEI